MAGPLLHLSDRVVDLDAHQVRLGDDATSLSRNEVALLRHLLEHEGTAVTRETLLHDVLGYAPQVVSRAADYAVHRLRKKLEADPSEPAHLLTVPGVGFCLMLAPTPVAQVVPAQAPPRHNLPVDTSSFLFREDDQARVLELLEGDARLVTLLGPAGVGKTRLSLRVGAAWLERHGTAVAFCDLSAVTEAPAFFGAVSAALGFAGGLGPRPAERLADVLAAEERLLVLDNVEQIIAPVAAAAAAWLQAAPDLRLLLTSRELSRSPGEHAYELSPLDEQEGAELFVERARAARPSFDVQSEDDWQTLRRLSHQLDGLPLAIELAAARSAVLSPQQMLDRLPRTTGLGPAPRGVPDRQASLDQAFAWSWDLLTAHERSTLVQLTAFRGAFDVDDAEAVVSLDDDAPAVVALVQALREKSLLVDKSAGGPPRFGLLRAVRDSAQARLAEPEGPWLRHARWIVSRAGPPARALLLGDPTTRDALEHDQANLAAAVERLARLPRHPTLFAQAVTAAHATWLQTGTHDGYLALVAQALDGGSQLSTDTRIGLHLARALFCQDRGGGSVAETSAHEVLALVADDPERPEAAAAWLLLASFAKWGKRFEEGLAALDRARAILGRLPVGALHIKLEVQSGNMLLEQHRFADADRHFRRALAQSERSGVASFESLIYLNLAVLRGWEHKPQKQAAMARRALLSARANGQRVRERRALLMLTVAQSESGFFDEAVRHGSDAVTLSEADHDPSLACNALVALAGIEFARGDLEAVGRHVRHARGLEAQVHPPAHRAYIDVWDALACWARWGSLDEAATLLERAAERAAGHLPHGEVLIASKQLALRAHRQPDLSDELAQESVALEEKARGFGRPDMARAIQVDRAHLALARARRALDRGDAPDEYLAPVLTELQGAGPAAVASDGLAATWSRVLLASAFAELELGGPTGAAAGLATR